MSAKPVILGAVSIAAVAALTGCGGSSGTTTPTPSGLSIPGIPGLTTPGSGTTGSSGGAGANTILSVSDVASISGDPNVAAVNGTCSATTCVYADTSASNGGGGGIIVVQPIPGGLSQVALQAALAGALSSSGSSSNSSGDSVTPVSGLGSAALKDIGTELRDVRVLEGQLLRGDQRHVVGQLGLCDGPTGGSGSAVGGGQALTAEEPFELGHNEAVILVAAAALIPRPIRCSRSCRA